MSTPCHPLTQASVQGSVDFVGVRLVGDDEEDEGNNLLGTVSLDLTSSAAWNLQVAAPTYISPTGPTGANNEVTLTIEVEKAGFPYVPEVFFPTWAHSTTAQQGVNTLATPMFAQTVSGGIYEIELYGSVGGTATSYVPVDVSGSIIATATPQRL